MPDTQKLAVCLWFDNNAEEAVAFYASVFPDLKTLGTLNYPADETGAKRVLTIEFELFGNSMIALNGGHHFHFNEAVSLVVNCDNQSEIDTYWDKLVEGGSAQQCGWLKDRYGLSWQIVPRALPKLLNGSDPEKTARVMAAMMPMIKLDLNTLLAA
ncbi:MAG: VOC family protein [Allorhizobium sp.]